MCLVSVIADDFNRRHQDLNYNNYFANLTHVSKAEFDALKKEVEALKELLKAAKKFDEQTGQPDCEIENKVELLKKLGKHLGVNMEDVFK